MGIESIIPMLVEHCIPCGHYGCIHDQQNLEATKQPFNAFAMPQAQEPTLYIVDMPHSGVQLHVHADQNDSMMGHLKPYGTDDRLNPMNTQQCATALGDAHNAAITILMRRD